MKKHYVVIGASAAGIAFINKIARLDPHAHITCITREQELPYNKCFLADYLAGIKQEEQVRISVAMLQERVTWHLGITVVALNLESRTILCSNDTQISFDTLFLAMGSRPWIPTLLQGHATFHTLADTNRILALLKKGHVKQAFIIGAGLSGIECADALAKHGVKVTIIEQKTQVLPSLLDQESAQFLSQTMESQGVKVITGHRVMSLFQNGAYTQVGLCSGQELSTDLVICATGLTPNAEVATQSGIQSCPQGVLVNEYLETSVPGVYAGGDLIAIANTLTGQLVTSCTWPDAMFQGLLAAQAAFGQPGAPYKGAPIIVNSAFFGLNFAQAGVISLEGQKGPEITKKRGQGCYNRFILENGQLKGFSVLGNTHDFGVLRRLILTGQPVQKGYF